MSRRWASSPRPDLPCSRRAHPGVDHVFSHIELVYGAACKKSMMIECYTTQFSRTERGSLPRLIANSDFKRMGLRVWPVRSSERVPGGGDAYLDCGHGILARPRSPLGDHFSTHASTRHLDFLGRERQRLVDEGDVGFVLVGLVEAEQFGLVPW